MGWHLERAELENLHMAGVPELRGSNANSAVCKDADCRHQSKLATFRDRSTAALFVLSEHTKMLVLFDLRGQIYHLRIVPELLFVCWLSR